MTRRLALLLSAFMAMFWFAAIPAAAGSARPYDAAAVAAAQKDGKSILIHVHAPWCPTCKAQQPILEKLSADPAYKDIALFELDFDTGGDPLRALNVRSQSTLIAFKGDKETGRSVGDTNADSIAALMKTAL